MKKSKPFRQNTDKRSLFNYRKLINILLFSLLTAYCLLCTVSYAEPPGRIISLAPALTEILYAAGLGNNIVGVTAFCDHPEEAKAKPKIGGMSNPSLEAVISLRPDIVVMTTDGNPKEFQQRLHSMDIKTYVFESLTLNELPDGIRKMGIALDEKEGFETLALKIEQTISRFHLKKPEKKKKVLFIIWPEPLIAAGPQTAIDDTINLLGAVNIAGEAKIRYPKYSLEEIYRQSPDIIFIGKGHKDMKKVAAGILNRLAHVNAVKNNRVYYVSDSLYRNGPRIMHGIEELAEYLKE
jgi:iron complex transport system substrate-binding protein